MIQKTFIASLSVAVTLLASPGAVAGPYADALGDCLVKAANEQDRLQLIRSFFFSLSLHPAIAPYSTITAAQREQSNKDTAMVFQKLFGESCATQAKQAIKNEGAETFAQSFMLLGASASADVMRNPAVSAGSTEFTKYLNLEKLVEVFGP